EEKKSNKNVGLLEIRRIRNFLTKDCLSASNNRKMPVEVSAAECTEEPSAPVSTPDLRSSTGTVSPRGWGELYRDHADFVWRSLRRMGLGQDAAKDALHDVFLVVHRRMD